jgi:hypothetical protein
MWGCTQPTDWHDPTDNVPPGQVTNVQVLNQPGGAQITYTLPADPDVMGAKVVYSLTADGKSMERFATTDTIVLEGYGDTNEHSIMVYAIDKSGNLSVGTPETIRPLTPPVIQTRQSLDVSATFGGVLVKWDNPMQKSMAVSLYLQDSITNEMKLYDTYFFDSSNGSTAFRNLPFKEQQFRVELHDRWDNYAAPLDTTLTPLFEIPLPGRTTTLPVTYIWKQYGTDANAFDDVYLNMGDIRNDLRSSGSNRRTFGHLHNGAGRYEPSSDGAWWQPGGTYTLADYLPGAATTALPMPLYFTIDMGPKAFYSRMNLLSRPRTPNYSADIPSEFEIWGSNYIKSPSEIGDGGRIDNLKYWTSWEAVQGTDAWKNDGWVKLGHFRIVTTSGVSKYTAGMPLSDEDVDKYRVRGYDFDMDPETTNQAFKYLRFVLLEINTGSKLLTVDELSFWGSYAE